MTRHNRPRAAFTLIEMIVVLSIMALLAALTAAAVMRLRESSRESNTNVHLNKIHMELQKQWAARVALINAETLPPVLIELTKDGAGVPDLVRARALHRKLRLRQEFPQNFGEVYSDIKLIDPFGSQYVYSGKTAFKTALKAPRKLAPNSFEELIPEAQSAALLALILSQGGGGSTTDVDSIARTTLLPFRQDNNAPDIQLKVFADEWGNPIAFRRWIDDDMTDVQADLNQPPFTSAAQVTAGNMDPDDPEGRLRLPPQNWFTPPAKPNNRQVCESFLARTDPTTRPYIQQPFNGWNRGPFVFSAGKNGLFYQANGTFEVNGDNLYSYRIAGSGKGN
ncbi:MAG TPA: prepilin-type N-terminal cleavage/methylation domain-containing protein [Gemmataceae bacterium]|nr:prepilin-type N-terminal cleavage/methylation domain-containing protein [Gemmataceae bacterium]